MVDDNRSAEMREIWALFAQEARDNLSVAETALLQLEQDRTESDQVAALFRAIHSFKGGARMMGLSVVEALAHHAEDLIALVRDEGVALQNDLIEALFAALDKSRTLLDQVLASGCDVEPRAAQALIDTLQQLFTRYQPAPDEASPGVDRSDPIGYAAPDEVSAPMTNLIEPLPPESTAPLSV